MSLENIAIGNTKYQFENQTKFYRGKVRDVYTVDGQLVMVASDRISAFDHILPRPIPYKGQVLNQIAAFFLNATRDITPNWLIDTPDPNVAIGVGNSRLYGWTCGTDLQIRRANALWSSASGRNERE